MTTITTGTSGPKAWKIALVAAAVGAAALAVANVPQLGSDTGQQVTQTATATLPESVTGFEYDNESTSGRATSPGVTAQYLGNSGELFPYENGPAPQAAAGQAQIDLLAPVITQEFLDGPGSSATQGSTRADPRAAVAAGFDPGAIDAVVGNTQVNPVPEVDAAQMIKALIAAELSAPVVPIAGSDDNLVRGASETNAAVGGSLDWEGFRGPFGDGTVAEYYTLVTL